MTPSSEANMWVVRPISLTPLEIKAVQINIQQQLGKSIHSKTAELVAYVNQILTENKQFGRVTVRQIYYQLVSRGIIENNKQSYQNYVHHLTTGRKAGVIPWEAFEDRSRMFYQAPKPKYNILGEPDPKDALRSWFEYALHRDVSQEYGFSKWHKQPYYVELWVEKDALAGFLSPLCEGLGVSLIVSRGYTSYTFKREAQERFLKLSGQRRSPVLLYLGDLDPSGFDIFRCLKDEIDGAEVNRIGLHPEDVAQYGLVPNPIKDSDLRTSGFRNLFPELGDSVYELDALHPGELMDRARREILKYFDASIAADNDKRARYWRANFTDYQDEVRDVLAQAGFELEN